MKTIIIAAVSQNNVIGLNGKLAWRNKEDIEHFKKATMNNAILMGRKTFDSIGKPLLGRINIIVSRDVKVNNISNNLFYFTSIDEAIMYAKSLETKKTFIIGGSEIYSQMINEVDELLISRMPFEVKGDTYFPNINSNIWKLKRVEIFKTFKVQNYCRIIN